MLASELENLNDTCIPWTVTRADFSPTASTPAVRFQGRSPPTGGHNAYKKQNPFSSITPPSAVTTIAPGPTAAAAALPRLPGASGDLPPELAASGGRWFARTVGEKALLLTFLPSIDVWRTVATERLHERRERGAAGTKPGSGSKTCETEGAASAAAGAAPVDAALERGDLEGPDGDAQNRGGDGGCDRVAEVAVGAAAARPSRITGDARGSRRQGSSRGRLTRRKTETDLGEAEDSLATAEEVVNKEHSLGLFIFLVRSGDFGLPIELPSGMLRDIRRVLLAHIPQRPLGALSAKPCQR